VIDDVLTEETLCAIADYHTRDGLKAWLRANGIPVETRRVDAGRFEYRRVL
jgi:hypothetical protein